MPAVLGLTVAAVVMVCAGPAAAQDRRGGREAERHRFQNEHWRWDNRFNHNHYYPSVGYAVPLLPMGHLSVVHRGARYFYHSGVWYNVAGGRYLVARPPLGVVIPVLPPGHTTVVVGGVPYHYANEVYYSSTSNGYVVAAPPEEAVWQSQTLPQPQPQSRPQQPVATQAPANDQHVPNASWTIGMWYYCDASRTYYPYVSSCAEPWRAVPAAPPPQQ